MTSGPMLVKPHAICALWPITMPGTPENEYPATSNGHSGPISRQCRPTWDQIDGIAGARWGSLTNIGAPVAVREPSTTQELDPTPGPSPTTSGTRATEADTFVRAATASSGKARPDANRATTSSVGALVER